MNCNFKMASFLGMRINEVSLKIYSGTVYHVVSKTSSIWDLSWQTQNCSCLVVEFRIMKEKCGYTVVGSF